MEYDDSNRALVFAHARQKKEDSVLISRDEALNRDFLRETGYCQLFDFHGFHTPAE